MDSVKCEVCSVECGVLNVMFKCGVWSVKCGV